jgi:hypothetical protein
MQTPSRLCARSWARRAWWAPCTRPRPTTHTRRSKQKVAAAVSQVLRARVHAPACTCTQEGGLGGTRWDDAMMVKRPHTNWISWYAPSAGADARTWNGGGHGHEIGWGAHRGGVSAVALPAGVWHGCRVVCCGMLCKYRGSWVPEHAHTRYSKAAACPDEKTQTKHPCTQTQPNQTKSISAGAQGCRGIGVLPARAKAKHVPALENRRTTSPLSRRLPAQALAHCHAPPARQESEGSSWPPAPVPSRAAPRPHHETHTQENDGRNSKGRW